MPESSPAPRTLVLDTSVRGQVLRFRGPEPRAVEITLESSVIVYDALFLAFAEDADKLVVTADGKLLKSL